MPSALIFLLVHSCIALVACASIYNIHETMSCCKMSEDTAGLMHCIDNIDPAAPSDNTSIALVTYASDDILDYAAYSFAVNSAYAEHNGYEIFFMSPDTGSNYEPRDQRWNRVKIIDDALNKVDGWLKDVDYVVWIDADLIFIDLDLSIKDLVAEYPEYDIIISAERHAETGVANTGSFIMRNSDWSRQFLQDWWNNFDRTLNHDQIFFDKLYKMRMPGIADHIKILPADKINSTPPPTIHQQPKNQVLHMMGQTKELRQKAFKQGFEEICRAYEEGDQVESQLGLTQPRLYSMAMQYFEGDLSRILEQLQNNDVVAAMSPAEFLGLATRAREHVVQIGIYNPQQDSMDVVFSLFSAARTRTKLAEARGESEKAFLPALYNSWAVYANDLALSIPDVTERTKLYREVEGVLDKLEKVISRGQLSVAQEMKLRLYSQLGHAELEKKDYERAAPYFKKSLAMLEDMGDDGNPVYAIDPLMSLGSTFCVIGRLDEGLGYLAQALDTQEKLLFAEQQLKQDHIRLATILLRAAGCLAKAQQFRSAKVHILRAEDILQRHPERGATESLLVALRRIDSRVTSALQSDDDIAFLNQLEKDHAAGKTKHSNYFQTTNGDDEHDAIPKTTKKKFMRKRSKGDGRKSEL